MGPLTIVCINARESLNMFDEVLIYCHIFKAEMNDVCIIRNTSLSNTTMVQNLYMHREIVDISIIVVPSFLHDQIKSDQAN